MKDQTWLGFAVIHNQARFNFDGYVTHENRRNTVDGLEKGRWKARLLTFPWVFSDVLREIKMVASRDRRRV